MCFHVPDRHYRACSNWVNVSVAFWQNIFFSVFVYESRIHTVFDNVNEKVKARHSTRDHSTKQYNQVHAFAAHDKEWSI